MTVKYAALAFDLSLAADKAVRLLPLGGFAAVDGRPAPDLQWTLSEGAALRIVNYWNQVPEQMVIDYEHQTQKAEFNGQPAPAAGWSISHELRDDGIYVVPKWTETAAGYIGRSEYKYISPVFSYSSTTGEVLMLYMAGLTNTPGLSGLTELKPEMLKRFLNNEDEDVDKELLKLLGLGEAAKPEEVKAALTALQANLTAANKDKDDALAQVATSTAEKETAVTELATLKAAQGEGSSVTVVAALQTQLATLQAQLNDSEVATLVKDGLDDGRILPSTKAWAEDLGKKDVAMLKSFLATAPKVAALTGQQSAGMTHAGAGEEGLTADELAVCKSTGVAPKDFAALKKEAQE